MRFILIFSFLFSFNTFSMSRSEKKLLHQFEVYQFSNAKRLEAYKLEKKEELAQLQSELDAEKVKVAELKADKAAIKTALAADLAVLKIAKQDWSSLTDSQKINFLAKLVFPMSVQEFK